MKLLLAAVITFMTLPSFAQIGFGTEMQYSRAEIFQKTNDNYNNNMLTIDPEAGYYQCKQDHNTILKIVRDQHIVSLSSLLGEIEELDRQQLYKGLVRQAINRVVLNNIMQFIIVNEMQRELMSKNIERVVKTQYDKDAKKRKKVFDMQYQNIDIDSYLDSALDAAKDIKFNSSISPSVINRVKSTLITEMSSQLKGNSRIVLMNGISIQLFNRVASGLAGEALEAVLKRTVITFSKKLFASLGQGMIIELVTMPLKGSRPSPESQWVDLFYKYPGVLVNPELMNEAGIWDNPWVTHCNTINRRAYTVEVGLKKLQKSIMSEIHEKVESVDMIAMDPKKELTSQSRTIIERDNLNVTRKPFAAKRMK